MGNLRSPRADILTKLPEIHCLARLCLAAEKKRASLIKPELLVNVELLVEPGSIHVGNLAPDNAGHHRGRVPEREASHVVARIDPLEVEDAPESGRVAVVEAGPRRVRCKRRANLGLDSP